MKSLTWLYLHSKYLIQFHLLRYISIARLQPLSLIEEAVTEIIKSSGH